MKLEVRKRFNRPCSPEYFRINGQNAELEDFGNYEFGDLAECSDEDIRQYGCYKCHFVACPAIKNERARNKYNLNIEEYDEVCKVLETEFNIGTCGWCV